MDPVSAREAAGYLRHVLDVCNDKLCGHYAHMWVKTAEGQQLLRAEMERERRAVR